MRDLDDQGEQAGALWRRLWGSWATRSLAVGALATVIDVLVGAGMLHALGARTRLSAMVGVAVGAAFTFVANRYLAFREHDPKLAKPALRFALATAVAMLFHGQLVVLLRDQLGVPFVFAKVAADVAVFSVGQLLVLRYVVFPKRADEGAAAIAPLALDSE